MTAGPFGWEPRNLGGDDVPEGHFVLHDDYICDGDTNFVGDLSLSESDSPSPSSFHCFQAKHGHIPRPPNAFIIYRVTFTKVNQREGRKVRRRQGIGPPIEESLSKRAGREWKKMTAEEQHPWKLLAEEAKKEHERLYPGYRYQPSKRVGHNGRGRSAKQQVLGNAGMKLKRSVKSAQSTASCAPDSEVHDKPSPLPTSAGASPLASSSAPRDSNSNSPPSPPPSPSVPFALPSPSEASCSKTAFYSRASSAPTQHPEQQAESSSAALKRRSKSCGDDFAINFPFSVSDDFMQYQEYCPESGSESYASPESQFEYGGSFSGPTAIITSDSSLAGWNGQAPPSWSQSQPLMYETPPLYSRESWDDWNRYPHIPQPQQQVSEPQYFADAVALQQYDVGLASPWYASSYATGAPIYNEGPA